MNTTRSTKPIAAGIAAAFLVTSPSPFRALSASAQQLQHSMTTATERPVELYITLCLGSQQRPDPMCRELPVKPETTELGFANVEACGHALGQAFDKWDEHAGPVFGFTATAGEGYRIVSMRCGHAADSASHGSWIGTSRGQDFRPIQP